MMIGVIATKSAPAATINAYRYGNVTDTGRVIEIPGAQRRGYELHIWETEENQAAQNQIDRLASGMIAGRILASEDALQEFLDVFAF